VGTDQRVALAIDRSSGDVYFGHAQPSQGRLAEASLRDDFRLLEPVGVRHDHDGLASYVGVDESGKLAGIPLRNRGDAEDRCAFAQDRVGFHASLDGKEDHPRRADLVHGEGVDVDPTGQVLVSVLHAPYVLMLALHVRVLLVVACDVTRIRLG
jgi:hypothetical protein